MKLDGSDYEFLKRSVVALFKEYKVTAFPIKPFELAKKMNIKCIPYSSLSKKARNQALEYSNEGYSLETNDYEWIIYYNDMFARGTINNIIIHEISHYWLGHTGDEDKKEREESEASFFAKYALTPPVIADRILTQFSDAEFKIWFDLSWQGATGAREYYESWLRRPYQGLTSYEVDLLNLNGLK